MLLGRRCRLLQLAGPTEDELRTVVTSLLDVGIAIRAVELALITAINPWTYAGASDNGVESPDAGVVEVILAGREPPDGAGAGWRKVRPDRVRLLAVVARVEVNDAAGLARRGRVRADVVDESGERRCVRYS